MHNQISFDEINSEINSGKTSCVISMDSSLSINIQNTNTKLFDTLRRLSSQQNSEKYKDNQDKDKGSYHNIPKQQKQKLKKETHTTLLTQSYSNYIGGDTLNDTENEDEIQNESGHNYKNSDTLNTMSSRTPTVNRSFLMDNDLNNLYDVGCNIGD